MRHSKRALQSPFSEDHIHVALRMHDTQPHALQCEFRPGHAALINIYGRVCQQNREEYSEFRQCKMPAKKSMSNLHVDSAMNVKEHVPALAHGRATAKGHRMISHRLPILGRARRLQVSTHVEFTCVRVDVVVEMRQPRNADDPVSRQQLVSSQPNGVDDSAGGKCRSRDSQCLLDSRG